MLQIAVYVATVELIQNGQQQAYNVSELGVQIYIALSVYMYGFISPTVVTL